MKHNKLWTVHLNDQNGLKYDQDKAFGVENLRQAFNQVRVLIENGYGNNGEYIGLDVKAMRTQKQDACTNHLSNSRLIFMQLLDLVRKLDNAKIAALISDRDYEELDLLIIDHLLGA